MGRVLRRLVAVAMVVAAAGALYAWVRARSAPDGGPTLVEVRRGDITETALAVGTIEPRLKFHVKSKISGTVKRCFVEVGDHVRAGDPLFELAPDPTPQELIAVEHAVAAAEATFERARADLERGEELARTGLLPASELDALREAYELARVQLERARESRELTRRGKVTAQRGDVDTIIRAPAGGVILTRTVDPGDPVVPLTSYQPGTELATIAEMDDLIFTGTVDEIDVGKVAVGMPCRITVGALPDAAVRGRVARIAPEARREEGATRFDVEIELEPGPGVTLRAGYSANAEIVIREKTGVLLIPERLVLFEDDGHSGHRTYVEVPGPTPEDPPRKVEVTLGLSDGLNVEVVAGLEEGDAVVERPPREIG